MKKNDNNTLTPWYKNKSQLALVVILGVGLGAYFLETKENVDPCKCAEVGANVKMIGYNNLSDESKKIFNACESKYSTPAQAYEACVDKVSNELP
jgi:hypothetical protein